jgi:hypothetical protein
VQGTRCSCAHLRCHNHMSSKSSGWHNISQHLSGEAPALGLGIPGPAGNIHAPSSGGQGSGIVTQLERTAWRHKDTARWGIHHPVGKAPPLSGGGLDQQCCCAHSHNRGRRLCTHCYRCRLLLRPVQELLTGCRWGVLGHGCQHSIILDLPHLH